MPDKQIREFSDETLNVASSWLMLVQKPTTAFDTDMIPISELPISTGKLARSTFTQEALERYQISLQSDVRNADGTVLDATGASTKFKIVNGGYGAGTLLLQGRNARSATVTDTLGFEFCLPPEYDDDADIKLNVHAIATGSGTAGTITIDAECYKLSDAGAVGSDLVSTTIITLTASFADRTFTITDAGLTGGDRLNFYIRTVVQETGGSNDEYSQIGSIEVQLDIKG